MSGWTHILKLSEVGRGPVSLRLEPAAEIRAQIAKDLGLESLSAFSGQISVRPWLDGAEIFGRLQATVEQICGVSAEAFEQEVTGQFEVRVVPAGSPNAPADSVGDVELDLEAPDPPDVLERDEIDVAHYLVEHLALEIDPFPRKPGAEFDYQTDTQDESPFAVLKRLKDEGE